MNSTWKLSRKILVLLLVVFVPFITMVVLQGQRAIPQQSATPTAGPETGFILDIPQKAMFRNYVVVSAEAAPGTNCELTYIPPSGDMEQMETIANRDGLCKWRWKIEESGGKGAGRLIFTIDGRSETHFFEILSSF